ncbi:MAG: thiamine ABC transporter substrate-binding protein [Acidimicrobiales bacterium mtb01]|nr:thiamine ABC transporter substrate-binding protein [Actinomycetota bacterium]TEX47870.1 MAG: thiamine ABC transporter substrate-binding protein [Acidimicrobiales bacterium mtb01]
MRHSRIPLVVTVGVVLATLVACGDDSSSKPERLVLVAYDSFTPPDGAFDAFTAATGIEVEVAVGGDAGELVAKAALTAGNPEGDVLWGVDNTLLSRAVEAEVFDPYVSNAHPLEPSLVAAGADTVTPVDYGDVCVNYDIAALDALGLPAPTSFDDLADPAYAGLLVVPSATSSSPGLAFLLATIVQFDEAWPDYWSRLVANDVLVVDGWSDAYYTAFSRYGGDRPLVLSYASSPPAEVLFADPPLPADTAAPTGVMTSTCFRQIEFAGVLRGTDHADAARLLVDYLVSDEFQSLLPESLFVYPANTSTALPESFVRHAPTVTSSLVLDSATIAANRTAWLETWSEIALP